jgi:small-conductance mechanosensitive channel
MTLTQILQTEIIRLGGYQLTVLNLLQLVLVYVGTHIVLALVQGWFNRLVARRNYDKGRAHSIALLIKYFAWVMSTMWMLQIIGLQASVLIASSAALFVGLGFGVQSIFKDIVSGIFLLFEGTIEVGDILEVDKIVGRVERILLRTTKLVTRDGVAVIIPNSKVLSENVVNWTHNNEATQFRLPLALPYGCKPAEAQAIMLKVADDFAQRPEKWLEKPEVRISALGEKSIQYELAFRTMHSFDIENIKSDLRFALVEEFGQAGIAMVVE